MPLYGRLWLYVPTSWTIVAIVGQLHFRFLWRAGFGVSETTFIRHCVNIPLEHRRDKSRGTKHQLFGVLTHI